MNTSNTIQPLLNATIVAACGSVVIWASIVVLCWNWWASVPAWLVKTVFVLSESVLIALFISLIRLRIAGSLYVRIHVVVVLLVLGVLVSLSGITAFPSSTRIRYLAAISSAVAPLMLLVIGAVE
jgi:hypothetical protein